MFFNSLVTLMDGWSKQITGVFHVLNWNKLGFAEVTKKLMILAIFSPTLTGRSYQMQLLKFARMID